LVGNCSGFFTEYPQLRGITLSPMNLWTAIGSMTTSNNDVFPIIMLLLFTCRKITTINTIKGD
jgi:hypothetical protein